MAEPAADPTPWVFRHRALLLAASFLAASLLTFAAAPLLDAPWLDAVALDPRLQLGSRLPLDGAPLLHLLAPTLLIGGAMALRGWGTSYLRGHVMADRRLHTDRLIVAGPFRWVRNPLYLGNLLFAAGFGLYLPPPGLPLAVAAMALTVAAIASAEERALRQRCGADYEAYAAKVSAFVPRPPPKGLPSGSAVQPDWRNGFLAEAWLLLVAAYLACIALRRLELGFALAGVALVGVVVQRARQRRRQAA